MLRKSGRGSKLRELVLYHTEYYPYRLHGVDMCLNIYDVRYDDESPACGMNWPPEIHAVTDYLGVSSRLNVLLFY
jgi:carboxypeptidase D